MVSCPAFDCEGNADTYEDDEDETLQEISHCPNKERKPWSTACDEKETCHHDEK
jgi:hypothetical protein